MEEVQTLLVNAGYDPYLCWGTLLGVFLMFLCVFVSIFICCDLKVFNLMCLMPQGGTGNAASRVMMSIFV